MLPDWIPVQHGVDINFDLDSTPLEIKTGEHLSDGWRFVGIVLNAGSSEAIYFDFNSPPQYHLRYCHTANQVFSSSIPTETDKIWRISKLPGPKLVIQCNEETILDFTFSDETCPYINWRIFWNGDVKTIKFLDRIEEVSKFYRKSQSGSS